MRSLSYLLSFLNVITKSIGTLHLDYPMFDIEYDLLYIEYTSFASKKKWQHFLGGFHALAPTGMFLFSGSLHSQHVNVFCHFQLGGLVLVVGNKILSFEKLTAIHLHFGYWYFRELTNFMLIGLLCA